MIGGCRSADTHAGFRLPIRLRASVIGVLAGVVLACGSGTEPTGARSKVFDITTAFSMFYWETNSYGYSDCSTSTSYCTHARPFTGASLSGTLTVDPPGSTARLVGTFCDAADPNVPTGCTRVKDVPLADYYERPAFTGVPGETNMQLGQGSYDTWTVVLSYPMSSETADTLRGTVLFLDRIARSSTTHAGTVVAIRRK